MSHDVIEDRYARLFELPHLLGRYLEVYAFCVDYRSLRARPVPAELAARWYRGSVLRSLGVGWLLYLLAQLRRVRPDYIVASSDSLQVILGAILSMFSGARFYADLYDDYASFGLSKIPGVRTLYRWALRRTEGICVVSSTLEDYVRREYPGKPVLLLESTINAAAFYPRDKTESRRLLGLDRFAGRRLVGVSGGLNRFHGVNTVFTAMHGITMAAPDVMFVVAGRLFDDCPLPKALNVHYLGMLPHDRMSYFFSALDVAIVALSNTRFGHFAFPQKAYEVLACEVPVVAANVGALARLFRGVPEALYAPDDPQDLARAVLRQLAEPHLNRVCIPDWEEQARLLAEFLERDKLPKSG